VKKIILLIGILLFTVACSNDEDDSTKKEETNENKIVIELKTEEEQQETLSTLTKDDYKEMYTNGWELAKEWGITSELVRDQAAKIMVAEETIYKTDLTKEEIITFAKKNINVEDSLKKFVMTTYKISASKEEVDEYIAPAVEELNLESAQLLGYAEALNMEPTEYFSKYYRSQFESQMLTNAVLSQLVKDGMDEATATAKFMQELENFRASYNEEKVVIEINEA
jgi:hypothetical protein